MQGRRRKWTDGQLRAAVENSGSMAQVLRQLGLRAAGGNYAHIHTKLIALGLKTHHWSGQAHLKGEPNPHAPRQPLDSILRKGKIYQSNKLRKRLLREGLVKPECSNCGRAEWLGRPIPLELDHKDGDSSNNELTNLRVICPNCHALTTTYRGKNAKYAHIPAISDVEAGIRRFGSMAAYAREKSVSAVTVRSWLRRTAK